MTKYQDEVCLVSVLNYFKSALTQQNIYISILLQNTIDKMSHPQLSLQYCSGNKVVGIHTYRISYLDDCMEFNIVMQRTGRFLLGHLNG